MRWLWAPATAGAGPGAGGGGASRAGVRAAPGGGLAPKPSSGICRRPGALLCRSCRQLTMQLCPQQLAAQPPFGRRLPRRQSARAAALALWRRPLEAELLLPGWRSSKGLQRCCGCCCFCLRAAERRPRGAPRCTRWRRHNACQLRRSEPQLCCWRWGQGLGHWWLGRVLRGCLHVSTACSHPRPGGGGGPAGTPRAHRGRVGGSATALLPAVLCPRGLWLGLLSSKVGRGAAASRRRRREGEGRGCEAATLGPGAFSLALEDDLQRRIQMGN